VCIVRGISTYFFGHLPPVLRRGDELLVVEKILSSKAGLPDLFEQPMIPVAIAFFQASRLLPHLVPMPKYLI